ncbi:MAG: HAD family hydrolase [Halothermotrichaceae bacterium]
MIKGVIFDFDGTLFNTNELIREGFKYTIKKELNRDIDEQKLFEIWGKPLEVQMKAFSKKKYKTMIKTYRNYYFRHSDKIDTFPGAVETVKTLKDNNYKVAILTNKGKNGLIKGLKEFNLIDDLDCFLSREDVKHHKPDPEGFIKIMNNTGLKSKELLMVGDSPSDIKGAQNVGIKNILVSYTRYDFEVMKALKPDYIIDDLSQVVEIINEEQPEEQLKNFI